MEPTCTATEKIHKDVEWDPAAVNKVSRGLSKSDPYISSTLPIDMVWPSFKAFIKKNTAKDKRGVVAAYNGPGSNIK